MQGPQGLEDREGHRPESTLVQQDHVTHGPETAEIMTEDKIGIGAETVEGGEITAPIDALAKEETGPATVASESTEGQVLFIVLHISITADIGSGSIYTATAGYAGVSHLTTGITIWMADLFMCIMDTVTVILRPKSVTMNLWIALRIQLTERFTVLRAAQAMTGVPNFEMT